jgi:hypothetical protein
VSFRIDFTQVVERPEQVIKFYIIFNDPLHATDIHDKGGWPNAAPTFDTVPASSYIDQYGSHHRS